jgi:hypothetical protein
MNLNLYHKRPSTLLGCGSASDPFAGQCTWCGESGGSFAAGNSLSTKIRPSAVKHGLRLHQTVGLECWERNESWINNLAIASAQGENPTPSSELYKHNIKWHHITVTIQIGLRRKWKIYNRWWWRHSYDWHGEGRSSWTPDWNSNSTESPSQRRRRFDCFSLFFLQFRFTYIESILSI